VIHGVATRWNPIVVKRIWRPQFLAVDTLWPLECHVASRVDRICSHAREIMHSFGRCACSIGMWCSTTKNWSVADSMNPLLDGCRGHHISVQFRISITEPLTYTMASRPQIAANWAFASCNLLDREDHALRELPQLSPWMSR
jgi:hypothetical protein